jgi:hypothetical protein
VERRRQRQMCIRDRPRAGALPLPPHGSKIRA